ncbi:MAG: tRNA glutamyl-Q(34) synthetase GluQRS [Zoogloeaceae bacterium]|nr:tRNA glutamyl-Q(34) synthetase GluQRS [Zoogloeaceae bacterium]MCK6385415.1 tRNA glutamyl-Q(34) synthetase GluQRS [Rhodocyclaceae bacterium]
MTLKDAGARRYRGRFAPSPTGPLHFGSLVAALGSCLDARAAGGEWLLRMEDVDEPRTMPGAAAAILDTLERFGFSWDGELAWQSRRKPRYRAAFERLRLAGETFACACTRREVADSFLGAGGAPRYPGTCRNGLPTGREGRAWRFRVDPGEVCFEDLLQGRICQDLAAEVGDFVLLRADGLFAYQLAVVVDDAEQGITHVVRGADLIDSTPRQIALQERLGLPRPVYLHLPAAVNAAGEKLSKQTRAKAIGDVRPQAALAGALEFLGQQPPDGMADGDLDSLWRWAIMHWSRDRLPQRRRIAAPAGW